MHNIHRFNCINMLDRMRTLYLHCLSKQRQFVQPISNRRKMRCCSIIIAIIYCSCDLCATLRINFQTSPRCNANMQFFRFNFVCDSFVGSSWNRERSLDIAHCR